MHTTPPGPNPPPPPFGSSQAFGTQAPPPPRPHRGPWRIVRREEGRLVAGVTTGVADAFNIDVIVVRVLWAIATIASFGLGVAAYAICWIMFPSDENPAPYTQVRYRGTGYVVGLVLIGVGLLVTFGQLVTLAPFRHFGSLAWATALIAGGLAVLFLRHPDDEPTEAAQTNSGETNTGETDSGVDAPVAENANENPATEYSLNDQVTVDDETTTPEATIETPVPETPSPQTTSAQTTSAQTTSAQTTTAWGQHAPWPAPPQVPPRSRRPRRPRPRSFLTPLTISLLLIGGGVVWLLDSNGSVHFTLAGIVASGLALVGIALVVSAWFGRARGLIPIGILLLLVTLPAAAIDVPVSGGIGNRHYFPTTRAELETNYEHGIGRLEIGLQGVPLKGRTTRIHAQLGIGELVVSVPTTVRVVVHAHAGAGSIILFGDGGNDENGWPAEATGTAPGTSPGVLDLDLEVGAGHIEVNQYTPTGAQTYVPANAIPDNN